MKILDRDYLLSSEDIGSFLALVTVCAIGSYYFSPLSLFILFIGYGILKGFFTGFLNGIFKAIKKQKTDKEEI